MIGLGNLGQRVATVGQAFGMRVIAWSQNLDPAAAAAAGVEAVDKQTLLRSADVVTIHLRLSERTRGLIGAADLALLKPTAFRLEPRYFRLHKVRLFYPERYLGRLDDGVVLALCEELSRLHPEE